MKYYKKIFPVLICALIFALTVFPSCDQKAEENAEYQLNITGLGTLLGIEITGEGPVDVVVPDGVNFVISSVFKNNKQIRSVTLPESLRELGKECFSGCVSLERVNIPEGVSVIPEKAFYGCVSLESVNIPDSVTSVDRTSFAGCEKVLQTEDGVYYVDKWAVDCRKDALGVTLRADTVGIAKQAFMGRKGLRQAVLPDGLLYLGDEAFKSSGIREIVLPDSLVTLGVGAFEESYLYKCQLPKGITAIPKKCFYGSSLCEMEIPDSVVSVGMYALYGCGERGLESVVYFGNWLVYARGNSYGLTHTVREGTVGIADGVFLDIGGPVTLKIPYGVKYFGNSSLSNGYGYTVSVEFELPMGEKIVRNTNINSNYPITINSKDRYYTWTVCINGEQRNLTYEEKGNSNFITKLICNTDGFEWLYGGFINVYSE